MSQTDSPEPQILYTFHVVKGADVLHASMTTGNPAAYTMVGIPIPDPELAVLLRNICSDGANLQ
jgi:hypothetical protein